MSTIRHRHCAVIGSAVVRILCGAVVLVMVTPSRCEGAGAIHLDSATYLGGVGEDWIQDMSVDVIGGEEVVTVAGVNTKSGSFTFLGNTIEPGDSDAFVVRLSSDCTRIIWSATIGGPNVDGAMALDVDEQGRVAVAGWAGPNFPTSPGAFGPTEGSDIDAFVAVLDNSGAVLYSTLLGGNAEDVASAVVMSAAGEVFVCGYTGSWDFPCTDGAYQTSFMGGIYDNFVCRIRPDLSLAPDSQLVYSTYLGGSANEAWPDRFLDRVLERGIALLSEDTVVLSGQTSSYDFPTTDEPLTAGSRSSTDAYLTVLACSDDLLPEEQLVCSFCMGGSSYDVGMLLAVDEAHNAIVAGLTFSTDFPVTADAFQRSRAGATPTSDGFVMRISLEAGLDTADRVLYSTYLGGSENDGPDGMGYRSPGLVALTGFTFSTNFPAVNADQAPADSFNAFLTLFNFDPSLKPTAGVVYSGRIGGRNFDQGSGAALGDTGRAFISGLTTADSFPRVGPGVADSVFEGPSEGFVACFVGGRWGVPQFKRGDTNASNSIDIADAVFCLGYLFAQAAPPSCLKTADANDDGAVDVADAIAILGHLFGAAGPLPAPFGACGIDPTADMLDCADYTHCQ